jgi:hypothetical protein
MQSEARRFIVKRSIPASRPTHRSGRTHRPTGPPVPAVECRRARGPGGTGGAERRRTPSPTAPTTPKATATGARPPPRRPRQQRNNATLQPTRQRNYFPVRGRRGRRQRGPPNHSIHLPEGRHQRGLATATRRSRPPCKSLWPAGFERFWEEISQLPPPPDMDAILVTAKKYQLEIHAP